MKRNIISLMLVMAVMLGASVFASAQLTIPSQGKLPFQRSCRLLIRARRSAITHVPAVSARRK